MRKKISKCKKALIQRKKALYQRGGIEILANAGTINRNMRMTGYINHFSA